MAEGAAQLEEGTPPPAVKTTYPFPPLPPEGVWQAPSAPRYCVPLHPANRLTMSVAEALENPPDPLPLSTEVVTVAGAKSVPAAAAAKPPLPLPFSSEVPGAGGA